MKRTEMIENIAASLSIMDTLQDEPLGTHFYLNDADTLLKKLEALGMKPPRLPEEYCQAIMHIYYAGYTFNQWEEEIVKDEKVMAEVERRRSRV